MFKKKRCSNCGEKISDSYNFCPYCRAPLNQEGDEDWGMLGKNDFIPGGNEIRMPLGFNSLFNNLMKSLGGQLGNLEMNEFDEEELRRGKPKIKKSGVSISIKTSDGKPPEIKVRKFGDGEKKRKDSKTKKAAPKTPKTKSFSGNKGKKFSKLPKKEPKTNLRRLSDKVIYEIRIPGVKSLDDISINQLESSIEIKAVTKDKAYSKLIPVNLPIKKYNLSKGTLVLELDARG